MERKTRLDTEALIQQCRQGYDANKNKEKLLQLQVLLEMRSKEIHMLSTTLAHSKEENALKIMKLEEAVIKLQQECAELRLSSVKCKRAESERAQQQIRAVRAECQSLLQAQQEKHIKTYRFLEEKHSEQLQRQEDKKLQINQLNRNENEVIKQIREEKNHAAAMMIDRIQSEKSQLLLSKREAEAKAVFIKESYDKIKIEFEQTLSQKEQVIVTLKGQAQGLRLKQKMLSEKIDENNQSFSQMKINKNNDIEHLQMANERLRSQNEALSQMLDSKNEEIMAFLRPKDSDIDRMIVPELPQCEHIGLIKQLERSLDLKDEELKELRSLIEQWRDKIGFDQPLTARFSNLSKKQGTIEKLKASQTKALRQSNSHITKKSK